MVAVAIYHRTVSGWVFQAPAGLAAIPGRRGRLGTLVSEVPSGLRPEKRESLVLLTDCYLARASRTLMAISRREKGFWRKWIPSVSTPCVPRTLAG